MTSATHSHDFLGASQQANERRTWIVVVITAVTMVAEIVAGTVYGSMALVADGWHMATHAAALTIAGLAYLVARRHAQDPRYSFGTGRLGDLAAFASALLLALMALEIAWESATRLIHPVAIQYGQAILMAVIGLVVNLVCAWFLGHSHGHQDHDHHSRDHHDHAHGHDNNLRAAYVHVLADALTSVLAIAALVAGMIWSLPLLDPLIGVLGAVLIARWSVALLRQSGAVLVGWMPEDPGLDRAVRQELEQGGDIIADLHVWQVGPGHHAVVVSLRTDHPQPVDLYKQRLVAIPGLSHITIELYPLVE